MAFILPVVVGVGATGAAAAAVAMVARPFAGRRVAILGGPQVGKSTLLRFLLSRTPSNDRESARERSPGGKFTLDVASKSFRFNVAKDVRGGGGLGYPAWKRQFFTADQVWYLFRSDLVALGDEAELRRVKEHLDLFKDWMSARNGSKSKRRARPNFVLIGTWADSQIEYAKDPSAFAERVLAATSIKVGAVKLNNAPLVIGGLITPNDALRLVRELAESLEDDL